VNPRMGQAVERGRTMFAGFTTGQRTVLAVAAIGLVLGAVVLTRFAAQPTWSPLFSNLSASDASAVVDQLTSSGVQYQLTNGGGTVLVPEGQVYDLRVSLAGKNLPAGDSGGWSLLDQQGMTSTDFQQNVAYQRALEGELGKTLQAMQGVRTAIVHLAIPKKDVFSTASDQPTASVLLALQPGVTPTRTQVRSVMHLVAGSVPGLNASDVTVTDANGGLLSTREDGSAGAAAAASETDEQTAQYEDRLGASLQQMLDRVVGAGHAVVRVNAQLDFATTETTSQTYVVPSPSVPALSEATSSESYNGAGAGAGGALGQTWPTLTATAGSAGGGSYAKSDRTVDNAVGTVVTKAQGAPGGVKRLTVAVVLDAAKSGVNAADVEQLVGNAVGIDVTRGDSVQVTKLAFDTTTAQAAAKQLAQAQAAERTAGYLDLGKKAGIGLVLLVVLVVAWRRSRASAGTRVQAIASNLPAEGGVLLGGPALGDGRLAAIGPGSAAPPQEDEQARARRNRMQSELAAFVDSQPDEIAQLVQSWLAERKG
jgi:flagellar M-ring protein FliF